MKKYKRKEFGFPTLLLFGSGFALVSVPMIALLLAIASYFTSNPTALTGAFSLLTLALAGALSGFVTSKANGEGGSLIGILSAVISAVVMLAVGLVWKGGLLPLGAVLNIAVFVALSCFAALLGKRRKAQRGRY